MLGGTPRAIAFAAVAVCFGGCQFFLDVERSTADPSDVSSAPDSTADVRHEPADGNAADGAPSVPSSCLSGRATVLGAGDALSLTTDDDGVYWGATDANAQSTLSWWHRGGQTTVNQVGGRVLYILPRPTDFAYLIDGPGGCFVEVLQRAGFGANSANYAGRQCGYEHFSGSVAANAMVFSGPSGSSDIIDHYRPAETTAPPFHRDIGTVYGVALDPDAIYARTPQSIMRLNIGGEDVALATAAPGSSEILLGTDHSVYWISQDEIRSVPAAGGDTVSHGTVPQAVRLAQDGPCIYVGATNGLWAIDVARNDRTALKVADDVPNVLAAGKLGVIWSAQHEIRALLH